MPAHPERVRSAPLPKGYKFGDAGRLYRADGVLMARGDRLVLTLPARFSDRDLLARLVRRRCVRDAVPPGGVYSGQGDEA